MEFERTALEFGQEEIISKECGFEVTRDDAQRIEYLQSIILSLVDDRPLIGALLYYIRQEIEQISSPPASKPALTWLPKSA